ncbi:MAG TPA: cupin domain-containing protein, partial [Gaiellaceae bacterium]|nr:cupin domain-containing protein [Gaiellaceae bacterium]
MVPEAKLEDTGAGLVPASQGWFVMNARNARWFDKPGQGHSVPLTGYDEYEAETFFPMLGLAIRVVGPGEPTGTYHWETEQEDFLVLAGEGLLIVEGQERPLKQWDFVHCPPETKHAFVGAGAGPCVILCASSRQFQKDGPWGFYCADETAARYNAGS